LTVLESDGVAVVPVHAAFTVISSSMVDAAYTLTGRLVTTQWVPEVDVTTALALLTPTANLQRVSPITDLTAVTSI